MSNVSVSPLRSSNCLEIGLLGVDVVLQKPELVVAQEADRVVRLREVDDRIAVGPAVDEVAKQDEPVAFLKLELLQQVGEFLMAAVDVPNRD